MGLHIALFAKRTLLPKLHDVATTKVKLGFAGQMGNKGATLIRFGYEDTSFCFINCHLETGHSEDLISKRVSQLDQIFAEAFVKQRGTTPIHYSVASHHVKVILGDLNYRLFGDNETIRRLVKLSDLEELARADEFPRA